ncbi:recQ-mediated genome instability protein 1 [Spiromyces aspiralis]|uniref:RecQ-mediated genome instability protein 1 n=1 Tax=Spiromyces aspiralis TaxID=68401 RepID=A0ACC1HGF7_9FUNG|nr:recQ-mediated genome instability protein 1 [Spiromyces aspiralis]
MSNPELVRARIQDKYNIILSDSWYHACLNFIDGELRAKVQRAVDTIPADALARLVFDQLLESDLTDSCHPSLVTSRQPSVASLPPHPVLLQIHDIVDIGVSKYQLFQAIKEREDYFKRKSSQQDWATLGMVSMTNNEELQREPTIPRDTLKLQLTDGRSCVTVMELGRVPQLDVELPIGTKLLIRNAKPIGKENFGVYLVGVSDVAVLGGRSPREAPELKRRLADMLGIKDVYPQRSRQEQSPSEVVLQGPNAEMIDLSLSPLISPLPPGSDLPIPIQQAATLLRDGVQDKVKVKARIAKLDKLSVSKGKFKSNATISDNSGSLDVVIDHEPLQLKLGMSVKKFVALSKQGQTAISELSTLVSEKFAEAAGTITLENPSKMSGNNGGQVNHASTALPVVTEILYI